jgi:MerR family transcriptional regulator, light-induced transcriptional regulator
MFIDNAWTADIFASMNTSNTEEDTTAPQHPIAVVAERTGLTPDLLRVWERRYQAVEPHRGPDGHRAYSDADVVRLRLLNAITSAGRSIGSVARLPTSELSRMAEEDAAARLERAAALPVPTEARAAQGDEYVEEALALTRALESTALDHLLRRSVARLGVVRFMEAVATPLLRRIGEMWHAGQASIAQEHLASAIVHDILLESMRSMVRPSGAETVVVAMPTGERHSIGAALIGAMAAVDGWRVIYLGADLPASEIAAAAITTGARVVAVSVVYVHDRQRIVDELRALRARLPANVAVVAGGAAALSLGAELGAMGIRVGARLADLSAVLDETTEKDAA